MTIQLLKRTVKLRIDRHIIVIPRQKDNMHSYPTGFSGAFKVKHFSSFLRKYEIRPQKNQMQTVATQLGMGFCEIQI